jgi:hypothetical protein
MRGRQSEGSATVSAKPLNLLSDRETPIPYQSRSSKGFFASLSQGNPFDRGKSGNTLDERVLARGRPCYPEEGRWGKRLFCEPVERVLPWSHDGAAQGCGIALHACMSYGTLPSRHRWPSSSGCPVRKEVRRRVVSLRSHTLADLRVALALRCAGGRRRDREHDTHGRARAQGAGECEGAGMRLNDAPTDGQP